MSQIVHVGHSDYRNVIASTNLNTTQFPLGWAADDVAYAHVSQMGSNSAITTPSGWTLLLRLQRTTTHVMHLYRRKLQAGDTVPSFVAGSAGDMAVVISAYRNVNLTTPEDVTVVGTSGTAAASFTGPDVGTLVTPCARIVTFAHMATTTIVDPLTVQDDATIGNVMIYGGLMGSGFAKQSGSMAAGYANYPLVSDQFLRYESFTQTGSTAGWIAMAVALRPADPATPPIAKDLRAAVRQPALRTWGQAVAGIDTATGYQIRLVVRAFNPTDNEGDLWSSGSDGGFWDLATFGGPGRWTDLTPLVRGLAWDVGADQAGGRPNVGTAAIDLQNHDGALCSWATTGSFTSGGESWFRTGTLVQIGITAVNSGQRWAPIFTGLIESVEDKSSENRDAWVTVNLVETASILATFNGHEQLLQGAGDDYQARFLRLVNDAGWPYGSWGGEQSTPQLSATFQATTLAGPRLNEIYLTADSAGTYIYTYLDGGLISNIPHDTGNSSISASFSNDPAGAELPCYDVVPYSDRERLLNVAIGARAGGTQQLVADALSISKYNQRIDTGNGWPRLDLICEDDATVVLILTDVLRNHAFDDIGIAQISVDADMRPASLYYKLALLQVFSDISIRWVHPSGEELSQDCYVTGMHHEVTNPGGGQLKWVTQLRTAVLVAP